MDGIVPALRSSAKDRLLKHLRECRDMRLRTRYLIVINLVRGQTVARTAQVLEVARSTVYAVAKRFREQGEMGLVDRREDNGQRKVDERYLQALNRVVEVTPKCHGWHRPTWTRELLVQTLRKLTGIEVHVTTLSRALSAIAARRGRPKPTVKCPWPKARKNRVLRKIKELLCTLREDEVAVHEDEVDIHLNPKLGWDWMVRGQQKTVLTPGRNEKRYLAGALDFRTGELIWVEAERKASPLFVEMLRRLLKRYPDARRIHVILDNYVIHSTRQVNALLDSEEGKRLTLHFLPPYCPDHNRIERTWEDLHANVTRNHACPDMASLMREVRAYLRRRKAKLANKKPSVAA